MVLREKRGRGSLSVLSWLRREGVLCETHPVDFWCVMNRRSFFKTLFGAGAAVVAAPLLKHIPVPTPTPASVITTDEFMDMYRYMLMSGFRPDVVLMHPKTYEDLRRITVPQFEIVSNPMIKLDDIKNRRFNVQTHRG